jgi:hypothetical protein
MPVVRVSVNTGGVAHGRNKYARGLDHLGLDLVFEVSTTEFRSKQSQKSLVFVHDLQHPLLCLFSGECLTEGRGRMFLLEVI